MPGSIASTLGAKTAFGGNQNRRAQGIDLSAWEETFDPSKATQPLDFVIYKASEGKGYIDPHFNQFYASSQQVPIKGAYHYLRSGVSTNAQVDTFLKSVEGKNLDFYAVDVENYGNTVNSLYAQQARDFIWQVQQKTGKPVLLYTNRDIYGKLFNQQGDQNIPLWIADPDVSSPGVKNWALWQSSFGAPAKQYGVGGAQGVDFNYFAGSPEQMRAWLDSLSKNKYQPQGNYPGGTKPGSSASLADRWKQILNSTGGNP